MSKFMDAVKPSQIETSGRFCNTIWKNYEKETVARNIVMISQRQGDRWFPFTWNDYQSMCDHAVSSSEHGIIEWLARDGYLDQDESDRYVITKRFIAAIVDYILD